MNLENIYSSLPIALQNFALRAEAIRIKRNRYNKFFFNALNSYKEREYYKQQDIIDYRNQRLKEFLSSTTQFPVSYKSNIQKPFTTFEGNKLIQNMPIIDKDLVKKSMKEIKSKGVGNGDLISAHTSGTTGSGLKFFTTISAHQEQFAVWWRYRMWHGIDFQTLCAYFGGRKIVPVKQKDPPFFRFVNSTNQIMFSNYHLNDDSVRYYVKVLNKFKPAWLHGYPSFISLLASLMVEHHLQLDYQVKWITCGAENLLESQITKIENAFGMKPIQHYGQAEAVANISECPKGNLHVDEDFSFVEFIYLNDNEYRIIGTNFTNFAFPLFRYDTNDIATISGKTCDCGRPGRIVDKINGRNEDYIILKNGARVGRLDHIFKDMVHINEAQIYQDKSGKIEVRIVKSDDYGQKDEDILIKEIRSYLGDIDIEIKYLDKIERTNSQKLRFVVSEESNP